MGSRLISLQNFKYFWYHITSLKLSTYLLRFITLPAPPLPLSASTYRIVRPQALVTSSLRPITTALPNLPPEKTIWASRHASAHRRGVASSQQQEEVKRRIHCSGLEQMDEIITRSRGKCGLSSGHYSSRLRTTKTSNSSSTKVAIHSTVSSGVVVRTNCSGTIDANASTATKTSAKQEKPIFIRARLDSFLSKIANTPDSTNDSQSKRSFLAAATISNSSANTAITITPTASIMSDSSRSVSLCDSQERLDPTHVLQTTNRSIADMDEVVPTVESPTSHSILSHSPISPVVSTASLPDMTYVDLLQRPSAMSILSELVTGTIASQPAGKSFNVSSANQKITLIDGIDTLPFPTPPSPASFLVSSRTSTAQQPSKIPSETTAPQVEIETKNSCVPKMLMVDTSLSGQSALFDSIVNSKHLPRPTSVDLSSLRSVNPVLHVDGHPNESKIMISNQSNQLDTALESVESELASHKDSYSTTITATNAITSACTHPTTKIATSTSKTYTISNSSSTASLQNATAHHNLSHIVRTRRMRRSRLRLSQKACSSMENHQPGSYFGKCIRRVKSCLAPGLAA
ncbi:unnamed protein product [Protopolystoma xenopodis]|uniref:Uncharacterized protein n=1 Tax=Protopolystoma xenopodis TaxID=117903 RepID=A0A448WHP8_9PLAT|nr:unnamed protein product [Protopolystoma xenopodis]